MNETQLGVVNMTQPQQQQQHQAWTISSTIPQLPSAAMQPHAPTPTSDRAPLSIYERIRHFLYINLLLNKYSFILSILSYAAQLVLFVALSLYLFSNAGYLYEAVCIKVRPLPLPEGGNATTENVFLNATETRALTRTIAQSYLTLQIVTLFVFFICFILSALIRLQFKYHRLALNMYDVEQGRSSQHHHAAAAAAAANAVAVDRDGVDSLASTTTGSHFSSSMSKKMTSLLKRILHRFGLLFFLSRRTNFLRASFSYT